MSKQREALELALEALQFAVYGEPVPSLEIAAMRAVRKALAEPEPWTPDDMAYRPGGLSMTDRKPLTDYQIRQIDELVWKELTYEETTLGQFALKMARAIERAHGIGGE